MSLLTPPKFKNHHIDAYIEGRLDEIPAECLEAVKEVAARRNKPAQAPAPEAKPQAFRLKEAPKATDDESK